MIKNVRVCFGAVRLSCSHPLERDDNFGALLVTPHINLISRLVMWMSERERVSSTTLANKHITYVCVCWAGYTVHTQFNTTTACDWSSRACVLACQLSSPLTNKTTSIVVVVSAESSWQTRFKNTQLLIISKIKNKNLNHAKLQNKDGWFWLFSWSDEYLPQV